MLSTILSRKKKKSYSNAFSCYSNEQIDLLDDYLEKAYKGGYIYSQSGSIKDENDFDLILGLKQNLLIQQDDTQPQIYKITERGVDVYQTGGIKQYYKRLKSQDKLLKYQIHTSIITVVISILALLCSVVGIFL